MPSQARHLEAAEANEGLATTLLRDKQVSWAVVVTFYSALHWVDAYFASKGIHPRDHDAREAQIRSSELRRIYAQYRTLYTRSREARYDLKAPTINEATGLLRGELMNVKAEARRLLGLPP